MTEKVKELDLTEGQYRELANKFIEAGNADYSITEDDLAQLGLKHQKSFTTRFGGYVVKINHWEDLCRFVWEKLDTEATEKLSCNMSGRGFRSRWFGKKVAEAILAKGGIDGEA